MKGDRQIIGYLNRILTNQLTAINQYFLHARMLKNWGVVEMGEYEFKLSIKEMKRADDLIERILFLDGLPNLQNLNKLLIGENVAEIVECDMKYELSALPLLREAVSACEKAEDLDWLETEQWQLANVGVQNYIQSRSGDGD